MKILWVVLLATLLIHTHAYAFETDEEYSMRTILDNISKFVDLPEGGVDWHVLGTTEEIEVSETDADGFFNSYTKPSFPPAVAALDGRDVIIRGYMFPMEPSEKQGRFLFGPFPISCPFHYHVGPSLVVEVEASANPVNFSYDAITLSGTFELVPENPDGWMIFYRLKNAKRIH